MEITKKVIQESLDKAMEVLSKNIITPHRKVEINYESDNFFIESARNSHINNVLINLKAYGDFDKEYASFAAVYSQNKSDILDLFELPYKITISLDRAKKVLSKERAVDVRIYLHYVLLHELIHLFEDEIKEKYSECYAKILSKLKNETYANEMFSEVFAYKYANHKRTEELDKKFNYKLYRKLTSGRMKMANHKDEKEMMEYINYI